MLATESASTGCLSWQSDIFDLVCALGSPGAGELVYACVVEAGRLRFRAKQALKYKALKSISQRARLSPRIDGTDSG